MRIRTTVFCLVLVLLTVTLSNAQYSARESFEYPVGTSLDALAGTTGNGWGGSWEIDTSNAKNYDLSIVGDTGFLYNDLSYNYPYTGNHLISQAPGAWASARYFRSLEETWPNVEGQYWVSYLFQTSAAPTGNTYYLLKLYLDSGELLALGKGGGGTTYTCGSGWPGGSGDDVSSTICEGGPVWLVAMIDLTGDADADANARTFMWINPDPSIIPDTNIADVKRNTDLSKGFNRVAIEFGGEDVMTLGYDEIRLGTSFDDVSSEIVTDVLDNEKELPSQFSLSQNFPNPFNPSTKISYTLKYSGKIRLSVYDLLGREVAVLVYQEQGAGTYEIPFNATGLSSGIYFYKLQTGNDMITKKMMFLK